jgi:hypothetical protein
MSRAKKQWIQDIGMKKGALHREMGIPQGEKIPAKKLAKASHSSNPLLRKRANLARTLKSFHHKAEGGPAKKAFGGGVSPEREAEARRNWAPQQAEIDRKFKAMGSPGAYQPGRRLVNKGFYSTWE